MTIDNVKDETWIRIASRWLGYVALAWVSYLIYQASGISISEQLARLSERRKPSSNPQIRVIPATPSALEKRLDEVFSASAVSSNQANNANAQQSAPSTTSSVPSEWVRLASRKQNKSNFVLHSPKRVKNNEVPDGSISSSAAVSVNRTETDSDTGDLLQKAAARNQDDDVDHKQKKPQQQLSQRQIAQSVNADFQLPEAIVSDEASVMRSPATPRVTSSMPTEARGPTEAPSTSLVGSSCSKNFDDRLCDLANRFHVTRCSFSVDKATSFGVPVTLLTPEDVCPPDTLIATDLTSANNDHYSSTNNKNNNTQHDHQYQYHIVTTPTHGTGKGAEPAAPSNDQVASEYESLTETAVAVDKSTSLNLVSQSNSGKRPGKHLTNNNGNGDAPLTSHEHDSINDNAHSHKNENNNNESNNNNTDPSYRAFQAHASHSANANTYCEVNGSGRLSPVASLLVCPDSDNALSCSSSSNSNEIAVSVDNKTTATRSIVTNRTAVAAGASCASIQTKATVAHAVSTTTSTADASNQHVSLSDSFDKVVGASTNADAGDPATVAPFRDQDSSDRQDNRQQDSWGKTRLSHSILDLVDTDEGQQGQQQQQQQRPQQNHRQEPSGFQSRHMGNGESCPQLEQSSTSKQQLVNHSCTLQSGRGFADIGSVDMINERCGTDSRGDIHQPTAGQIGQARKLSPTIAAACRRTSTSGALAEDTYLSAADVSTATASRCVGLVPGRRTGGDPLLVQVLCDINDVDEYHQLTRRESVDEPWPLPGLPSFHSDVGSKADFGSDVFGLGHSERGTIETGVRKRTQPQERQGDLSSNRGNCAIKNKTSGLDGDFAVELDCSSVKTSGEVGGSKCRVQSPHSGNVTAAQVISDGEDKISSKSPEQTPENHVTESLKVKQEAEAVRWDLLRRSNTGQEKSDSLDSSCEEEGVAVNQQNDYLTGGTNEVDSAVSEKTKQQVSLPDFRTPPPWPRPTFHNDFSVGLETMDINANNNESINSQNEEISSVPQLHVINVLDGILFQGGVERRVLRTFESGGDYEMVYRDKLDRLTVGNDHSLNEMRSNSSTPDSTRDQRNRKAIREEDFSDLLPPLSPDPGYDSYSDRLLGSPDDCFERLVRSASPVQLRVITEEEEADRPQSAPISSNTKQSLGYEETTMVRVNSSATTAPTTTGTPSDKEDREPGRDVMAQIDSALMAQLSKKFDGITQMSDSDVNGFYVTRVATAKDVANAGASTQINDKANTEARSVDESGRMTKKAITDVLQPVVTESPMSECEANADDIEIMMDNSASFLRAARAGNLEKVLEYLKGSIDINTSNANGLNALHLASKEGHVPVVKELLHRGAEVNAATKKGNTALHIASLAGQTDVVRLLVEKGANVNAQSQNGFTPLYMAAQENHDAVVRLLLANNASQSLATEDGFTPLAVALQQGHDKVVAVLLENDAKGKVRLPALHIAAKKDDTKAAALLLQTHEHNPDVTSKSGFTPLHIAAHYGNANIAALLLEKGADVNFPAKHQITPLHVAAKWGKANMVKLLLEEGAKLDASTRDGLTPLHCAARSGHDQVVDQLIEKGAPITAKTKNGLAPLHMASQGDHVESAKILLNHKAPVDEITVDYLTALHVAAHCGHVGVAKLLLEKKADANSRALNGFTPLHIACKKNRIKVVELLLRHGASIEATTESGLTPLHVASFMGCMNIVIYLIQHGANADVPTVRGETPLHLAARANQTDIVRILLRNGAQVDTKAREQQTPLHIAARLGNTDIVGLLLQHGAHVDSATKDQYTALHIAAKEGQEDVVNMLLDHGASVTAKTKKGFTPLHLAAKYGNLRVAKLLLQKEADVDAQGKNGVTPLHVAAHYDHNDVALLLLEQGASPHAAAKNGYTSLHIAAKKNQMDIGSTLLEYGAKTNAESKAGFSALHLAVQEGHAEMAALLIEHGANVDAAAKNGLTPLHLCAQEDKVNVAAILAKHNARIDPATAAGYTPLHVACHFGQTNMIRFLLQHGADVNATTTHGYTPLHQAAQQGHTMIINLLLENRAQPNATTNQGQTALSIAQKLGYISVIETLKVVTETTVTTTTTVVTEEKYKVVAPETMHETFMSDSEDEGEQDNMMGDHSFKYLTADEMKSLGDDSLPIDVTRDERLHEAHVAHIASQQAATRPHGHIAPSAQEEDRLSPSHLDQSFAKAAPDNVEVKRTPVHAGFLVSFMVDARGGAMRGCRHSGVRVIIPPRRASMPMRVTCRFIRKEKLAHPPPLMEGEACAARIIEMGPAGAKFLGPVVIEVPHFASLRGKEREIVILRSDNGEAWKEHTMEATEDAVSEVLNGSFDAQELNAMQDFNTNRVTRILTTDFPQYFAVVCRNRQEVHSIGPEGGMVSSTVVSQVQAIFPDGALTKKIKVGLQVNKKKKHKFTFDHNKESHLADTETLSDDLSVAPKKQKFGRYFSCFHTASPVKSFGEKRPSDSTTVDIHEGLVAPRKRFFIKAKTAMRVAAADSTNNNNMKPVKKSSLKASFPFGLGNKKKEVKAPCDQPAAATVERAAKENNDKNKHDKDDKGKQGSSIQSVPETELPVDNVSDVATVVCESPVKSHTLSCSTPRPIGDSVVEELAISLMTFLNEDKLLEEVEGSSTQQRKALTPELTPSRSPLVSLTPSKKRHGDQPLDMDDVPSSPKKQRLFRSRVLHRKKSKEKNKPKHTVATPERSLAVVECEKAEMKSVRSETNLEVSNIIKNTQSMESIDLNSETQSRKDSALEVTKVDDADDVQNVSQKKGFLMRFGRHRVSSVVKVATDEPSSSTVQADDGAAQPSSEERPGKASIIKRLRKGKPSSDMESTQNATSPNATVPSKHGEEKPKKSQRKRSIRPSEKVKVFKFFEKRSEPDDNVAIIEGPRESEIEASVGMRVCESQLEDEKAVNAKSEKKDKYSNKDDLKSNKKDEEGKCESFLQENKTTKKRKKKVLFSRFTVQKPERRNRHSVATINKETTDGETSTTEENQNKESEKELSTLDEKIDEAKSEADTTVNQDSGQRTSEPITSERRDSEQSSRGFFSWFTGWRSVDDKIKEVPESCCDTTAEKSEAAKDLDPNTEADVSDIQSESESVTDECAGEKRIDLEEQMQPKAEQKDKLETSKNDADKPTEVLSTKTKSLLKRFRRKRSKKFTDLIDSGRGESSEGSRPSSGKTMSRPSSASKLFLIFRQSKLVEKTTTEEAKKADEIVGTTTSDKTKVVASEMDDSAVASDPLKDEVLLSEQTSFAKDKQKDQPAENLEEPLSISEKDSGYEPGRTDKKALSTALYSGRRKPRRNRNRKDKGLDNSAKADVPLTEVAEEKVIPRDIEIRRVAVQMSSPQQVIEQKPKTIETKVAEVKDTKVIEVVIRVNDQKAEGKLPSPAGAEGKRSRRRRRGKKKSPTKPTEGEDTESQHSGKGRKQRLPDADTAEKAAKDDLDEIKPDVKYITADTIKSERSEDSSVDDEVPSAETAIQDKAKDFEAEKKSVTMLVVKEKQSLLKFWHTKKSTASSKAQAVPAEMGKPISTKTDDITEDFDFETRVRSNKKKAFLDRFQKSKAVEPYIASDNGGEDQANADTTRYAESPHMETSKSHQSNKGSASSRKGSQAEGKPQKGLLSSFLQWSLGRIESPEKTEVRVTRWHSELVLASTKEDDKDAQEPKIEIVIHDIDKKQGDFRGRVQSTESETQRSDTTSKFETPVEEFKPLVREQRKATGFFSNFGWPASLWTFGTGTEDGGQQDNAEDGGKTDTSNETQGRENVSTEAELAEKATKEAETKPTKSNATVMDGVQDSEKAEEDVKTTESQEANDKEVILKDVRKKEKSPIKDKTERKAKNEKLVLNVNDGAEKVDERAERSPDDISAKTVDKQRSFLKFPTIKLAKMSKSVKNLLNTEAKTASKFEKEEAQFESEESQVDSKPEDEDTTERTDKYYQGEKTKAEVKVEPKKARCSFLKNSSVPKLPKSKKGATEQSSIVKPVKTKKEDKERKEQNKPSILEDSYKEDQLETDTEDERLAVKPKPLGKVAIGAASASEPLVARASEEEKSTSESAESPKRTITITIPLPKFRIGRKNKGKRTSAKKHKAKRTDKKKLSCYKVAGKKSVVTENVTDQDASDTVVENADDALRCETTKVTDVLEKKAYRVSSFLNPIFRSNKKTEPQVKVDIRNNKGLNAENKMIEEITDEKAETAANSLEETPSPIDKAKNTEKGKQPQDEKPSKSKRNRRGKKSNPFSKEKSTEHVKTEAGETKVKGELDGTIVDKKTVHQAEEGPKQKSEHPSTIADQPAFSESPKLSGKRAQETQQFFAVKLKFNKAKRLTESTPIGDDKKITETSDNEQKQVDKKNRDLAENAMQADEKKAETGQYDDELLTDRPTETPEPIEERQAKMRRTFTINFAKFLAKDRNVSIEEARKEAEKNGNVHEADDDKSSLGGPKKDTEEFKDELNADHRKEREPKKEQSAVREKQDTGKCYEFKIPNFCTTATTLKKSFNKEEYPKIEKEPKAKGHSDKNKVCNKAEIISKMDVQLEGEPTESVKEKSYTEKIATDKKEQFVQCAAAQRDTKKLKFTINFHKPTFVRKRETKRANKEVLESPVHAEKAGIEDSDEKNAEETEQDSKMSGPEDETSTEKVEVADGQIYSKTTGETELIAVEEQGKAAPKTPKKSSLAVPRLSWPKFFSLKKHDKSGSQETVDKARKFSVEEANDLQDTVPTEGLGEIGLEEAEIDGMKTTESHDIAHLGTPSEVTPKKNDEGRKQVTFTITIPKLSIPKFKPKMNVRDISDETATKSDIEQTQKDDDTVKIYESATDLAKLDTNKTGETEDETVSVEKKPMDSAKKGNAADATKTSKRSWWHSLVSRDDTTPTKVSDKNVRQEPSVTQEKFFRFSKKSALNVEESTDTLEKPILEPVPELSENEASKSEDVSKDELADEQPADEIGPITKEQTYEAVVKQDNQEIPELKNTAKERKFYAVFKLGRKVDSSEVKVKDAKTEVEDQQAETKPTKSEVTVEGINEPISKKPKKFRFKKMLWKMVTVKASEKADQTNRAKIGAGSIESDLQEKSKKKVPKKNVAKTLNMDGTKPDISPEFFKKEVKKSLLPGQKESPVLITKQDITIDAETGSVKIEEVDDAKSSPNEEKRDAGCSRNRRKRRNRNRKNRLNIMRSCDTEIEKTIKERKSTKDENDKAAFVENKKIDVEENSFECSLVEEGAREVVIESNTGEVTKVEAVSKKCVVTKNATSSTVVTTSSIATFCESQPVGATANAAADDTAIESITEEKAEHKKLDKSVVEESFKIRDNVTEVERKDGTTVLTVKFEVEKEKQKLGEKRQSFSFLGRFSQKHRVDSRLEPISDDSPDVHITSEGDVTPIDVSYSVDGVTEENTVNAGVSDDKKPRKRYFKPAKHRITKNAVDTVQLPDNSPKATHTSGSNDENAQNSDVVKTKEIVKSAGSVQKANKQDAADIADNTFIASKNTKDAEGKPKNERAQLYVAKAEKGGVVGFLTKRFRRPQRDMSKNLIIGETTVNDAPKQVQNVEKGLEKKTDNMETSEEDDEDEEESTVESTKNESGSSDSTEIKDTSDEDSAEKKEEDKADVTQDTKKTDGGNEKTARKSKGVFGWLKRSRPSSGCEREKNKDFDGEQKKFDPAKIEIGGSKDKDLAADKALEAPNVSVNGGDSSKVVDTGSVKEERSKKKTKRFFQKNSKIEVEKLAIVGKKGFGDLEQDQSAGASTSSQAPKYDHFGRSYTFHWPGVRYTTILEPVAQQ